jgi:phosphoribosylformimino-5-aminoimidazole carboxamide ribotide isomerase
VNVIPVIDLQGGEVVRGVGGRRHEYRRVETVLTDDATPAGIARAFATRLGVEYVYVADLDAIAGAEPNWAAYEAIGASGLKLWIDAGAGDSRSAARIAAFRGAEVAAIIVGLESLLSWDELRAIGNLEGYQQLVFSLDLKDGRPITGIEAWRGHSPEQIADAAVAQGFTRMIVLDLAHVGEPRGPGASGLCRRLHDRFPHVELTCGGGVRSVADARALAGAGCSGVLIASALHDGRLAPDDVAEIQGL